MTRGARPSLAPIVTPAAFAIAATVLFALPIAQSLYRVPIQVGDSLDAIIEATRHTSLVELVRASGDMSSTTFRPMRYGQAQWLLQTAEALGSSYHLVFRGLHVALLLALAALFFLASRVRTWVDAAAFALGLTVFFGMHTFVAMLHEAYPVNHFAQVAAGALAVLVIAQRPARSYAPLLTCAMLAYGLLLIESAVLIWVAVAVCFVVRLEGISRTTLITTSLVLLAYVWGRHVLGITSPGIGGHGSGYGMEFYSPAMLEERFGGAPLAFVVYNIAGAVASTLFSEPRAGVSHLLRAWSTGAVQPVTVINVTSSLLATVAVAWYALSRLPWRPAQWTDWDRIFVAALVTVGANAVFAAAYIKDEIVSVAGVFYAVAVYVAVRAVIESVSPRRPIAAAAIALALALGGCLWAFRTAGVHFVLRQAEFKARNDWVQVLRPDAVERWPPEGRELELTRSLYGEARDRRTTSPSFLPRWGERYWVE